MKKRKKAPNQHHHKQRHSNGNFCQFEIHFHASFSHVWHVDALKTTIWNKNKKRNPSKLFCFMCSHIVSLSLFFLTIVNSKMFKSRESVRVSERSKWGTRLTNNEHDTHWTQKKKKKKIEGEIKYTNSCLAF